MAVRYVLKLERSVMPHPCKSGALVFPGIAPNPITAVNGISTPTSAVRNVYDLGGRQLASPQRGLNILRQADGTTKKLLTK